MEFPLCAQIRGRVQPLAKQLKIVWIPVGFLRPQSTPQGATILAADSPLPNATTGYNGGTYDAAEPNTAWDAYQDYGHNHWHNSLIWGEGINDISITGPGLIYGKGLSFGAGPGRDLILMVVHSGISFDVV